MNGEPADDQPASRTATVDELLAAAARAGMPLEAIVHPPSQRLLTSTDVHRPGLALVGHFHHHHPDRVQVLGETEVTFLADRGHDGRCDVLRRLVSEGVPAFVVTRGLEPPADLLRIAAEGGSVVMRTPLVTREAILRLQRLLEELVAPSIIVHGVMIDVFGVGVLLRGPSGIGKSECALELVLGGHRLVADDLVEVRLRRPRTLIARSVGVTKHHMEIRGLGIINVQDLFGVAAVRDQKRLELIVNAEHWDPGTEYDRVGIEPQDPCTLLGVPIEQRTIPIRPGRNLSDIVQVAARNHILKIRGVDSAGRFRERLNLEIARNRASQTETASAAGEVDDFE